MQIVWDFFQKQILGMQWLNDLIGRLLSAMGVDITGRVGATIQFFIYDVIKILVLLSVLIFVIPIYRVISRRNEPKKYWEGLKVSALISLVHCWGR
jgi:hypothetical protein